MKKLAAVVSLALALVLTGCAARASDAYYDQKTLREQDVKLDDGRSIHCLFWIESSHLGGMSCDWAGAE